MKKPKTLLLAILAATLLVAGGLYYYLNRDDSADQQTSQESSVSAREEALRQARDYAPPAGQMCTTVITPARHSASGATYEFPTGCIPDGWERISQDEYERDQTENSDASRQSGDEPGSSTNDSDRSGSASTNNNSSQSNEVRNQSGNSVGARDMTPEERAREEARNFRPEGPCTTVITPARHIATGVVYEFPTGCIPDGWERLHRGGGVQGSQ